MRQHRNTRSLLTLAAIAVSAAALLGGCKGTADPSRVGYNDIRSNPTPELMTLTERGIDVDRNVTVTHNQNRRMFWEDLGRVFLTDHPSRLSPMNINRTSGKPR